MAAAARVAEGGSEGGVKASIYRRSIHHAEEVQINELSEAQKNHVCKILGFTKHSDGTHSNRGTVEIFRDAPDKYTIDAIPAERLIEALLRDTCAMEAV